ncbi:glycerophosphoryl diester phosphodiesterase family protein [Durotheca rogersii]|uniref:glycerophosphoryl diester phosphodiesterase family protein n=1 Tax=Durotheca rogersii TaxID=419775 RepID=UPI00221F042A|nr:glycerophosphoryl diester phosphodiesterase family protein [Durotheca rogersii]KAI5857423.1 glycerophosphoryl diester phosphodiesterase family protein [Durotheca rogersii]
MRIKTSSLLVAVSVASEVSALPNSAPWWKPRPWKPPHQHPFRNADLGPRPQFLVNDMDDGWLKDRLSACSEMEAWPSKFSIGHRGGACLQFPEETRESVEAGTRMGAGIQECDVAFTSDRELVCRHDQCDLHTTTNIVATDLGAKCTTPFTPARDGTPATARCCTSDITLAEFKSLCGKMDGSNASATTPEDFLRGTPSWRTDLYSTCGTVLSHKEFIKLVDSHGRDFTTELKEPRVPMPFDGDYTQERYAQQVIDEYRAAGIDPSRVWLQSFVFADVAYWLRADPAFGEQAVLLDESGDTPETFPDAVANLTFYKQAGVKVIAPPLPYLVILGANNEYVPSIYATTARKLGFKILTWSLERSGPLAQAAANNDYYYSTIANGTHTDGDMYRLVDVLARQVGVLGIFSDWSATVTYYANCFGLF